MNAKNRMGNYILTVATISVLIFSISIANAQTDEKKDYDVNTNNNYQNKTNGINLRPGMELKKIGGLNLIVPEGTQVYRDGAQVIMEGPDDYAARNIKEMKNRLDKLENNQERLKKDLDDLTKTVNKFQEK